LPGSNGLSTVKTVLNNLWTRIGYEDDGYLVHTDKRTGVQKVSLETWLNVASAKDAVAVKLSKIEWQELNEPPAAAFV
jgi:hypothetical protein